MTVYKELCTDDFVCLSFFSFLFQVALYA